MSDSTKPLRILKKAAHPLETLSEEALQVKAPQTHTEPEMPSCVTQKRYGSIEADNNDGWSAILNKGASMVYMHPDGTVITTGADGSRSELRDNGTIVSYAEDGSIKFFRTGTKARLHHSS